MSEEKKKSVLPALMLIALGLSSGSSSSPEHPVRRTKPETMTFEEVRTRQSLWEQMKDERKAYRRYMNRAEMARKAGMDITARIFEQIAYDEKKHAFTLKKEADRLGIDTKYWRWLE